ncbi:MAG: tocopherol cyclase family protein [Anaerolineae bacterium]|jgi:hypothetical protein|nr:tocopherol cyclase family protein [Anaerolineae bacterium]
MKLKQTYDLIHHPDRYHGELMKPPFFEGWYFKVVSADRQHAYAFIPGISFSPENELNHAFIQVLDGNTGKVRVKEFPVDQFYWSPDQFDIYVGKNHFNMDTMELELDFGDFRINGMISFGRPIPWPQTFFSPGIMGPFGWLPFMQCMHGVLSFDHGLTGTLDVNGQAVSFDRGRGYIEKDWGKSFPSSWIWMQSNHFQSPNTSFTLSIATIPFGFFHFTGVIAGLWWKDALYPFCTYQGVKTEIRVREQHHTEIILRQGGYQLLVQAERKTSGSLHAPTTMGMDRRIMESLDATIHIQLWKDDELLLDEIGDRGGLEIVD